MENKTKDEGAKPLPGGIQEETECVCCEDGECSWNPKARSEEEETKG